MRPLSSVALPVHFHLGLFYFFQTLSLCSATIPDSCVCRHQRGKEKISFDALRAFKYRIPVRKEEEKAWRAAQPLSRSAALLIWLQRCAARLHRRAKLRRKSVCCLAPLSISLPSVESLWGSGGCNTTAGPQRRQIRHSHQPRPGTHYATAATGRRSEQQSMNNHCNVDGVGAVVRGGLHPGRRAQMWPWRPDAVVSQCQEHAGCESPVSREATSLSATTVQFQGQS